MIAIGALAGLQVLAILYGVLRRGPVIPAETTAVAARRLEPATDATAGRSPSTVPALPTAPVAQAPVLNPPSIPAGGSASAGTADEVAIARAPVSPIPVSPAPVPAAADLGTTSPFLGPVGPTGGEAGAAPPTGLPPSDSPSLFAALDEAARSRPFDLEILERLMVTGSELRANGNMQGALQAYRQVENDRPEDPRVLAEIAATLGKMGLEGKSKSYWERVDAFGEIVAGPYFALAGQQLRGEAPPTPPTPPEVAAAPRVTGPVKTLKIGEVNVEEAAPSGEGQRVALNVVVDADPASKPVAGDLDLLVYFYDRLPGGGVDVSTAVTSYLYPTEPYDWQTGGTETIVVNYHQPRLDEEEAREAGKRVFHGYVIELYYRDELQDKVTMPEELAGMRFDATERPAPAGPENALFPTPVP